MSSANKEQIEALKQLHSRYDQLATFGKNGFGCDVSSSLEAIKVLREAGDQEQRNKQSITAIRMRLIRSGFVVPDHWLSVSTKYEYKDEMEGEARIVGGKIPNVDPLKTICTEIEVAILRLEATEAVQYPPDTNSNNWLTPADQAKSIGIDSISDATKRGQKLGWVRKGAIKLSLLKESDLRPGGGNALDANAMPWMSKVVPAFRLMAKHHGTVEKAVAACQRIVRAQSGSYWCEGCGDIHRLGIASTPVCPVDQNHILKPL